MYIFCTVACIFLANGLQPANLEKDEYMFIMMGAVLFHIVMHLIMSVSSGLFLFCDILQIHDPDNNFDSFFSFTRYGLTNKWTQRANVPSCRDQ